MLGDFSEVNIPVTPSIQLLKGRCITATSVCNVNVSKITGDINFGFLGKVESQTKWIDLGTGLVRAPKGCQFHGGSPTLIKPTED